MKNGVYPSCMPIYNVDDLYSTCSKQHCREYACIVWLNGSTMHLATHKPYLYACTCSYTIGPDMAMEVIWKIFLLSMSAPLKTLKVCQAKRPRSNATSPFVFFFSYLFKQADTLSRKKKLSGVAELDYQTL